MLLASQSLKSIFSGNTNSVCNSLYKKLQYSCFIVPLCLRFHLLTRFPEASLSGRQGITVVSDHRSMVLTYIDVGSVDTVYYIRHNWAAQQS